MALTRPLTRRRHGEPTLVGSVPAAASTTTYAGSLVSVVSGTGYGRPAATATTHLVLGVATQTVDNSAGSNGSKTIPFEAGVFEFTNSTAGDAITQAHMEQEVFVVDDDVVAATDGTGTRSVAGICKGLANGKVKVFVGGPRGPKGEQGEPGA